MSTSNIRHQRTVYRGIFWYMFIYMYMYFTGILSIIGLQLKLSVGVENLTVLPVIEEVQVGTVYYGIHDGDLEKVQQLRIKVFVNKNDKTTIRVIVLTETMHTKAHVTREASRYCDWPRYYLSLREELPRHLQDDCEPEHVQALEHDQQNV